jgi:hypothetical protein
MTRTLIITTVTGLTFEETGDCVVATIDNEDIYYINGNSYPASIVTEK